MGRVFDMCDICKLEKAGICDYKCVKRREDFMFRFHTCPNFIYDNKNPITNAELLSTDLKTNLDGAAIRLWYQLAMDNGISGYDFNSWEEYAEWLKKEAVID